MSSVTGTVVSKPVHHHAERVADQDHVAIFVDQPRGVRVIGGQAHDRLAALAGADVGRGQPLDLVLRGHVEPLAYLANAGTPMT